MEFWTLTKSFHNELFRTLFSLILTKSIKTHTHTRILSQNNFNFTRYSCFEVILLFCWFRCFCTTLFTFPIMFTFYCCQHQHQRCCLFVVSFESWSLDWFCNEISIAIRQNQQQTIQSSESSKKERNSFIYLPPVCSVVTTVTLFIVESWLAIFWKSVLMLVPCLALVSMKSRPSSWALASPSWVETCLLKSNPNSKKIVWEHWKKKTIVCHMHKKSETRTVFLPSHSYFQQGR